VEVKAFEKILEQKQR